MPASRAVRPTSLLPALALVAVVGLGALHGASALRAGPPAGARPGPGAASAPAAVPPVERRRAAERGLDWLAARALALPQSEGTPVKPFTLAFTGLDVLLEAGDQAPRGERARLLASVRRALAAYLTEVESRLADPEQLPEAYGLVDSRRLVQYVWPVALHGWLLAECAARGLDAEAARADLRRVARVLEEAQHADDGWGHGRVRPAPAGGPPPGPAPGPAPGRAGLTLGGYPPTLLAPTHCAAAAVAFLDRALGRGLSPAARRARAHYGRAVLRNGNVPYDVRQQSATADLTGVGRAAGALVALHALGAPADDPLRERVAGFLRQHWDLVGEGHGSPVLNLVFGALAARLLRPEDVRAFEAAWLPAVLARQDAAGAFDCACQTRLFGSTCDSPAHRGLGGLAALAEGQRAYVTALTTFVLLLDRGLPRILAPGPATPAPAVTPR